MVDPREFDVPVAPRVSGREVAALFLTVLGAALAVYGAALYDGRAAVIVAGALALVLGVLLGMG